MRTLILILFTILASCAHGPQGMDAFLNCPVNKIYNGDPYELDAVVLIKRGNMRCTGVFISNRAVLTAGHCVGPEPMTVDDNPVIVTFVHPEVDLAVIHVLLPVNDITPLAISPFSPMEGEPIAIVGRGSRNDNKFGDLFGGMNTIFYVDTDHFMYLSIPNICDGDSGGPTLDNKCRIMGIHSSGSRRCGYLGIDIRTDIYKDWIELLK